MGFPIAKVAARAALVGAMIAGGLLAAGIAQAQAQTLPAPQLQANAATGGTAADGQPTMADRQAELIAAAGGPAPVQHLIMSAPERPAVETRDDDVADATPDPADALNAAEAAKGQGVGPAASVSPAAPATPQAR